MIAVFIMVCTGLSIGMMIMFFEVFLGNIEKWNLKMDCYIIIGIIVVFGFFGLIGSWISPITIVDESKLMKTRPATMKIVELDYENDVVFLADANGFRWTIDGIEDWHIGDLVSCTMDTKETTAIYDDKIVEARYSGYNVKE